MSYHVVSRDYPDFVKKIEALPEIYNVEGMECPNCGEEFCYVDSSEREEYTENGAFVSSEQYYCDNCGTFADVTQVYEPTVRRVSVGQDVYDEPSLHELQA